MNTPHPAPFSIWRHVATNSTYTVLGVSTCSTNGPGEGDLVVVYLSHTHQTLRHRALGEFLDGRFEHVEPPPG